MAKNTAMRTMSKNRMARARAAVLHPSRHIEIKDYSYKVDVGNGMAISSSHAMEDLNKTFLDAYQVNADALFRFCYFKLSDRELARDFVQETYMKAWKYLVEKPTDQKEMENLRAFLYKIAGNLVIDEYRRRGNRMPHESLENLHEQGFDPSEDETASWIDKIDGKEAIQLIKKVPEPYGEAVFMRYVQSLTLQEIAEITGESENTISVRVHRGLARLKKLFNRETESGEDAEIGHD